MICVNWLVHKWRQLYGGYYNVGYYVYTRAELESALKAVLVDINTNERAAEARREYDEFIRRNAQ